MRIVNEKTGVLEITQVDNSNRGVRGKKTAIL
jgi:hypothetical protein